MEILVFVFFFILIFSNLQKPKKAKTAGRPASHAQNSAAAPAASRAKPIQPQTDERLRKEAAVSAMAEGRSAPVAPLEVTGRLAGESGSLNAKSREGECVCDPSLAHGRRALEDENSVYATEISDAPRLDFSPAGLYQGVVMSEILTRPAQRRGRWR